MNRKLSSPNQPIENRWIRFQKWHQKWNNVMTVLFVVLLILLLMAILVVNIMDGARKEKLANKNNTNYDPDSILTSSTKYFSVPLLPKNAFLNQTTQHRQHRSSNRIWTKNAEMVNCYNENDPLYVEEVDVTLKHPLLQITSTEDDSIQIEFPKLTNNSAILWFNGNRSVSSVNYTDHFQCLNIKNDVDYVILNNISNCTAYTICLVDKKNLWISPFECVTYYQRLEKIDKEIWITEDLKLFYIGLSIFGILLMIFIGLCMIYMVLRSYPILLRCSKRIVVVDDKKDDSGKVGKPSILVMPKEWNELKENKLSQCNQKISTIDDFNVRPYEQPRYLSRFEVVEWELEQAIQNREQNQIGNLYAPTLPPRPK